MSAATITEMATYAQEAARRRADFASGYCVERVLEERVKRHADKLRGEPRGRNDMLDYYLDRQAEAQQDAAMAAAIARHLRAEAQAVTA